MKEKVSDNQLIQEFLNGDEQAFNKLYKRYQGLVYSVIYGYTEDRTDLKDFSQDIWMKVFLKLKLYKPEDGHFSGWLITLSKNTCKDRFRGRNINRKYINRLSEEPQDDSYEINIDTPPYDRDLVKRLLDNLDKLNPIQKDVILLRLRKIKFEKIAEILGKKKNTCISAYPVGLSFLKRRSLRDIRLYKAAVCKL